MYRKLFMFVSFVFITLALSGCTWNKDSSDEETEKNTPAKEEIGVMVEAGYIDVTPQEAKELIDDIPDIIIIDVSPKYEEGHLPGAINYYVGDGSLDTAMLSLDQSKTYLIYCHVDSASILGATKLVDAGFNKVYRLKGNYSAWVDAGYAIE